MRLGDDRQTDGQTQMETKYIPEWQPEISQQENCLQQKQTKQKEAKRPSNNTSLSVHAAKHEVKGGRGWLIIHATPPSAIEQLGKA